jgi:hypothetical protein
LTRRMAPAIGYAGFRPPAASRRPVVRRRDAFRALPLRKRVAFIAYMAMILSWALDFRSEGAGQGLFIQVFFIGSYFAATTVFYLSAGHKMTAELAVFVASVLIFIGVGVMSSLLSDQSYYGVFRNVTTILIYVTVAHATFLILMNLPKETRRIRQAIACFVILYMLAAFLTVLFFQGGIDVSHARYEVIGTSVVAAVSYAALSLRFRLSRIELAAVLSALGIIALSVTRTWIVVLAVQLAVLAMFGGGINLRSLRRGIIAAAAGLAMLAALEAAGMPVLERWTGRLFAAQTLNVDPTGLTRQRQLDSMQRSIAEHPYFGAGLQGESVYWLETVLGGKDGVSVSAGFGHNQHISIVFVAGLIGGGPILLVQLWQFLRAFSFIFRSRNVARHDDLVFVGVFGALIVIGTVTYGMFGGTFGSRGLTLWYGVGTGLLLGGSHSWRRRSARARAFRPERTGDT